MADDIHTITFTDVSMTNGHGATGHFGHTTVTIDYTTHTVTGHVVFHVDGQTYHFDHLI
jgi:hypothetical protein